MILMLLSAVSGRSPSGSQLFEEKKPDPLGQKKMQTITGWKWKQNTIEI